MGKGQETRERILEIAESAVLAKGFGATSIEEIITEAGITKSGFFYHFRDKNELARALLARYREKDAELQDQIHSRALELTDDPLHALLAALRMFAEAMQALPDVHPGCMVATICYHERLFDADVRELNREAILGWRARYRVIFERIAERYPPHEEVDLDVLADTLGVVTDGAIIASKALGQPAVLPAQVLLLRSFIKRLFLPHTVA